MRHIDGWIADRFQNKIHKSLYNVAMEYKFFWGRYSNFLIGGFIDEYKRDRFLALDVEKHIENGDE